MNFFGTLILVISLNNVGSVSVLAPLSKNAPDPTRYNYTTHPRQPQRLKLTKQVPLHTNKFYTNAIVGTSGHNPILTHPYIISMNKDQPYGVSISLTEELVYGPEIDKTRVKYFVNRIEKNLQMSAIEFISQAFQVIDIDEPGFSCTIKMYERNSSATITMPLTRGMVYVTFEFVAATPRISTIHSMMSINGRNSGNITGKRFEIVLNNGQTWLLYSLNGEITFKFSKNQLVGAEPVTGVLRLAKKQADLVANTVLDAHVGVYPVGCQLHADVRGSQGLIKFQWKLKGDRETSLLHFTFPHHRQILSSTNHTFTKVQVMSATKGLMVGYIGNVWTMKEDSLTSMGFLAPRPSANQHQDSIVTQLKKDLEIEVNLTISDYYFTGKKFHKYALLCLLAKYYQETVELSRCLRILRAGFDMLIERKNTHPLHYDTTWSGLISSAGLQPDQEYADFGNSYYNDHHYHWGYFIQAGAIMVHLDTNYLSYIREWIEGLIRDANNPSPLDFHFPQFRFFDWFAGHSWSQGLFESADGKDQESISEEINFHYGVYLWGSVTQSPSLTGLGRLMLATAKRAAHTYFLMEDNNQVMPKRIIANKVTGIFFENKAEYTTWFGTNPEFIHGIQMIPCTPITEEIRMKKFVEEEWTTILSKIIQRSVPEWQSLLYMNYAIINPDAAFTHLLNVSLDDGLSRTWALYWAATRPNMNNIVKTTTSSSRAASWSTLGSNQHPLLCITTVLVNVAFVVTVSTRMLSL